MSVRNVEVEDACAAASSFAFGGNARFPNSAAAYHQVAFVGKLGELLLERGVIFV
jgi:hypothetical protein